jgi:hypothetical protein
MGNFFERLLDGQKEFLETVKNSNQNRKSGQGEDHLAQTFRIQPTVTWQRLDDSTTGPTAAEDYFKQFESLCSLANTGKGMRKAEMLIALQQTLGGSRKTIFENVMEERGPSGDGTLAEDPDSVYQEIKRRLLRFKETTTERELRVQAEWDGLIKTKNVAALQFEASWEAQHRELERVGLGLNE